MMWFNKTHVSKTLTRLQEAPKDLNAHRLRGTGHSRTVCMPEWGGGLGLLFALRCRMRTKSLEHRRPGSTSMTWTCRTTKAFTGGSTECNNLHGPVFASVVPHPLSRKTGKDLSLSYSLARPGIKPLPQLPVFSLLMALALPSSLRWLFLMEKDVMNQGDGGKGRQQATDVSVLTSFGHLWEAAPAISWMDKANRPRRDSQGMCLKAAE